MSLNDQLGQIGERLAEGGDFDSALTQFNELVRGQTLRNWVAEVEATHELSKFEQVHPNSFNKYVLAVNPEVGSKLVLHSWHSGSSFESAEIHNHRWNFISAVLNGSVEGQTLNVDPAGDINKYEYRYSSPNGGSSFELLPVGEASLRVAGAKSVAAGGVYFQYHDLIHRARPAEPNTVTLVLQGPVVNTNTRVFREFRPDERRQVQVHRPETHAVAEDFSRFTSLLREGL